MNIKSPIQVIKGYSSNLSDIRVQGSTNIVLQRMRLNIKSMAFDAKIPLNDHTSRRIYKNRTYKCSFRAGKDS